MRPRFPKISAARFCHAQSRAICSKISPLCYRRQSSSRSDALKYWYRLAISSTYHSRVDALTGRSHLAYTHGVHRALVSEQDRWR